MKGNVSGGKMLSENRVDRKSDRTLFKLKAIQFCIFLPILKSGKEYSMIFTLLVERRNQT
ncbi:MAG TPA: hypothetical protein C5S37_14370 [Methanophagales archaeon]|nr:hypothetical protein [Methanophagales archaeon]